ncbi:MAG: Flp pilus assembly complex ATPase component TadA [Elusimicrobia bacterium]|nr:Flp pilus assembly complex ATPase component TadA [Elusimicrobiota bacterium]
MVSEVLSQLLVDAGILTREQITQIQHSPDAKPDDTLDSILVRKELVHSNTMVTLLAEKYKVPFIAHIEKVDIQILKMVPEHLIEAYEAVPIQYEEGVLTLAMVCPGDQQSLDRISALTGHKLKPVGILEGGFRSFYSRYFEDTAIAQILKEIEISQREGALKPEGGTEAEKSQPMGKLLDSILLQAVRKRASDIHIEPQENLVILRFRIDGVLKTHQVLPHTVLDGLVRRIKVMAGMNIIETRLPQDGQFKNNVMDHLIDVRVAVVPSQYGEKMALRLLDRTNFVMSLDLLGMPADAFSQMKDAISRPNGLILVTGPTGSGKTTTLYALIQQLRSPQLNILTLEDPIEYELLGGRKREGGITQIQINAKVGLTFASGLRACLRQDPDIILVGEIRDKETVETAISAALTGHLVLSSLHTNGAVQTVARLMDMGVEPFLVASALRAVLSQRLVRLLCHQCKIAYRPSPEIIAKLGLTSIDPDTQLFKPNGCTACVQQGYWGRTGIYELLTMDNELNSLIMAKRLPSEIFFSAKKMGFKTMQQHGMELVAQGLTSLEEILRVLPTF